MGTEIEGFLGTFGEKVPPEEEGASVEAVVAGEETYGCQEGEHSVVAGGEVCGGPGGVIVIGRELGERVDVFPGEVGEVGELDGGRRVFDDAGDHAAFISGTIDGLSVEG